MYNTGFVNFAKRLSTLVQTDFPSLVSFKKDLCIKKIQPIKLVTASEIQALIDSKSYYSDVLWFHVQIDFSEGPWKYLTFYVYWHNFNH